MPVFSKSSKEKLEQCHPDLQRLLLYSIKIYDFTIRESYRSIEEQERLFKLGKTKVRRGKHNNNPSLAVDIYPYPIFKNLDDEKYVRKCYYMAGIIYMCAYNLKIPIRLGGDW